MLPMPLIFAFVLRLPAGVQAISVGWTLTALLTWSLTSSVQKSELQKRGMKLPINFHAKALRTRIEGDVMRLSDGLLVVVKHTVLHCLLFALLCAPKVHARHVPWMVLSAVGGASVVNNAHYYRESFSYVTVCLLITRLLLMLALPPQFSFLFFLVGVLHLTKWAPTRSADLIWLFQSLGEEKRIPVLIITGYLGSGKTTLLNRILHSKHGWKVAVIENEIGEVAVDGKLVESATTTTEEIIVFDNGCICCNIRGDLAEGLRKLAAEAHTKGFDLVVVETTGVADPAPVAQTFFVEPAVQEHYRLDAVVCLVDSKHFLYQLQRERSQAAQLTPTCQSVGEGNASSSSGSNSNGSSSSGSSVQEAIKAAAAAASSGVGLGQLDSNQNLVARQVSFADRVIINKIDLVSANERAVVAAAVRELNPIAAVVECERADVELLKHVVGIRAFSVEHVLKSLPQFRGKDADVGVGASQPPAFNLFKQGLPAAEP
jgi:G3E family GTPase